MKPTHRFSSLLVAALFLALLASPALAAGNISFLDPEPLAVLLPAGAESAVFKVAVFNAGETPQAVRLEAARLTDAEGAPAPAGLLAPLPAQLTVEPRTRAEFELTLQRQESSASEYTGRLVLFGSDGSLAYQGITLKLPQALGGGVLDPRFTRQVTRQVVYPAFGFLWPQQVAIPLVSDYDGQRRLVGQLAGPGGALAPVWQSRARLEVEPLPRAGAYSGTVDLQPLQPGTLTMLLTLQVRDSLVGPLLALIFGLLLANWLDRTFRVDLPEQRLRIKLREAVDKARKDQKQALADQQALIDRICACPVVPVVLPTGKDKSENPPAPPEVECLPAGWAKHPGGAVFRIAAAPDEPGKQGLLVDASRQILDEFAHAPNDALRAKWGPDGGEVEKAHGYIDSLAGLHHLSRLILETYRELTANALFMGKVARLNAPGNEHPNPLLVPLIDAVLAALTPRLLSKASQIQASQESLKAALALLRDYQVTFNRAANSLALSGAGDQRYDKILNALVSIRMAGSADLELIKEAFHDIELDNIKGSMSIYSSVIDKAHKPAGVRGFSAALFGGLPLLRAAQPVAEMTTSQLRSRLRWAETGYWLVSAVVVILTGLQALYWSNQTFGSWLDYLGVLLWGVVVSEGVRLGRTLIPQVTRWRAGG